MFKYYQVEILDGFLIVEAFNKEDAMTRTQMYLESRTGSRQDLVSIVEIPPELLDGYTVLRRKTPV